VSGAAKKLFTIPSGISFLDALVEGVYARIGDDPAALTRATILLPTRRACRAMREAFLRRSGGKPTLLPQLRPIGDVDDDELALAADSDIELPPAISTLRRRLVLARSILKIRTDEGPMTAPQAIELAAELALLLDQVQTEGLGFDLLEKLVPEEYAEHWRRTIEFLKILTAHWPDILAVEGALDPAERRNRALAALAAHWQAHPPTHPVIAAGSTGSIPATARLLDIIAGLPGGMVVLPGLDRELDEESWSAIDETHPQFGMKQLLASLEIERAGVQSWSEAEAPRAARRALMASALQPAATTGGWRDSAAIGAESIDGIIRVDCAHTQEEAQVIALVLREALETEGRTAALVTPDRELARRVAAELARFSITIDDSAGQPLAASPPAVFLRLVAEAIATGTPPAPLLALLKHPLAATGLAPAECRRLARALEIDALRGPRPAAGFDGLRQALPKKVEPSLSAWIDRLAEQASRFATLTQGEATPLALLQAHVALAELWAATDAESGPSRLWAGDAGEAAADLVAELAEALRDFPPIPGSAYPSLFAQCLSGRVLRPAWGGHARLQILGPLEARLLSFDVVVLGGLNEGTWPPEVEADPWMSRPMRKVFGLPAPERRIGLAAHDFVQACGAAEVVLTRAERVEGAPTVPSRWLQRLDAVLRASPLKPLLKTRAALTQWQAALDHAEPLPPVGPPEPRPPVAARPRQLSVTEIGTWFADPYALYARRVLRLERLDPLDMDPGVAERGLFIHEALEKFVSRFPDRVPAGAVKVLLEIGREAFGPALSRPGVWAFWWPRFEAIAEWFVAHESERRAVARPLVTEGKAALEIDGLKKGFRLIARADRIDRLADGTLAIIDYKTGSTPDVRHVVAGLAPQLPLEAAMASRGAFVGVPAAPVSQLRFWHVTGGDPAGEEIAVDGATFGRERQAVPSVEQLAEEAMAGLRNLIAHFDDPQTPYHARPRPDYALRYNDYAHLARIKEWASEDGS
jgi:ATP-dependent helicase/nuclease subunit B